MFPEADAVAYAEGNMRMSVKARTSHSGGVCVAGMHEMVRSRNLGGPIFSPGGRRTRNSRQVCADRRWEVRSLHSTEEAG
jgi:hypothetical protein